jgi:hypothetical protein
LRKNKNYFKKEDIKMKKSFFFIILFCPTLLIGCATTYHPANPTVFGRTWELLAVTAEGQQVFLDRQKIRKSGNFIVSDVRVTEKNRDEYIGQFEINCASNQYRTFGATRYDKKFQYMGQLPDDPWKLIPAGSPCSIVKDQYCATNKPASPVSLERSWEYIGTNELNSNVFIDPKTLTYSGSIVKTDWRMTNEHKNGELLGQIEVDCRNNQLRIVDVKEYDSNLRIVLRFPDMKWQAEPAISIYRPIRQKYCR